MSIYLDNFDTIYGVNNNIKALRNKVLELAIHGKLVEQDPNDEPALELIKKIQSKKDELAKTGEIKKLKPFSPIENDDIPFEIPGNWEWVRLEELGQIIGGGTPKSEDAEYWFNGTVPWITPADLSNYKKKHISYGRRNITEKALKESSAVLLPKGTVLFSSRAPIGYVAISSNEIATNQGFKSIVPYYKNMEEYIYYFMKWDTPRINEAATGTTFKEVSGATISNILIPLPPLAEQYRIVAKVESLMSEIDRLEESLLKKEQIMGLLPKAVVDAIGSCKNEEELKEQLQFVIHNFETIFQTPESMQDLRNVILQLAIEGKLVPQDSNDEPASELIKKIRAEKEELVKEGKIKKQKPATPIQDDDIPFEIPANWEWVRMGEIIDIRDGTHDTPQYTQNGYPLVTSKNISTGRIDLSSAKFISEKDYLKILERSKVDKGDIIYAMIGTIGNPVIVTEFEDFAIKNVALFKPNTYGGIDTNYLKLFLELSQNHMKQISSGGVQSFVSLSFLREYPIPIPPLTEQLRIVKKIESIMISINQMEAEMKRKADLVEKMASA